MSSRMSITILNKQEGAVPITIFQIKGEVDATSYEQLQAEAKEAREAGMHNLLLDLTGVTYISSAGLRAIHYIFNMLRAQTPEESDEAMSKGLRDGTFKSPHLKLLNPTPAVLEILKTTGMDMYLEIHHNLKDALASFKPAAPAPEAKTGITVRQLQGGKVPVTLLQPYGYLDASNYKTLIAQVQQLYDAGARDVLLDMSDVPYVSSSGLVALHSIAKILRAEPAQDLESGWDALHAVGKDREQGLQQHIKLLSPQPEVDTLLTTVGFKNFFEIYTDLATALASF
jgi:anti-anti-sigma factor